METLALGDTRLVEAPPSTAPWPYGQSLGITKLKRNKRHHIMTDPPAKRNKRVTDWAPGFPSNASYCMNNGKRY